MNKNVIYLLVSVIIVLTSCKQQKEIVVDKNKCKIMFKPAKALTASLKENEFHFTTLKTKMNVETKVDSTYTLFTTSCRIKKDSIIWMSISKFGIEAVRLLISKDSVHFINKLEKKYFVGDFEYLSDLLNTQVDFEMLQSLLVGNSVDFYDDDEKIKAGLYKCQYVLGTTRKSKLRKVVKKGKDLKESIQSIYLQPKTFKISRIQFYEFNPDRSIDVNINEYVNIDSTQLFPSQINYQIKAEKNIDIDLKYTKYKLNESLTFPFKIPDTYKAIIDEKE